MRPRLDNVVLEIILMKQHQSPLLANPSELTEPRPIPRIEFRQVIFAQPLPRRPLTRTREWLLIKRRQHVPIDAANTLVVIPPTVVPQPIIMIERRISLCHQPVRHPIQIIREPRANPPRHKTRHAQPKLLRLIRTDIAAPPSNVTRAADE